MPPLGLRAPPRRHGTPGADGLQLKSLTLEYSFAGVLLLAWVLAGKGAEPSLHFAALALLSAGSDSLSGHTARHLGFEEGLERARG